MQSNTDPIHIMADIESLDVIPTAVIISIGAVTISGLSESFYLEVDRHSQTTRTVSQATLTWWAMQSNMPTGGSSIISSLCAFSDWIKSFGREPIIWCKGTDFDVAILTNAYKQYDIPVPWKYNNIRDCRTVFKVANIVPIKASHNALKDAKDQAEDLMSALVFNNLRLA